MVFCAIGLGAPISCGAVGSVPLTRVGTLSVCPTIGCETPGFAERRDFISPSRSLFRMSWVTTVGTFLVTCALCSAAFLAAILCASALCSASSLAFCAAIIAASLFASSAFFLARFASYLVFRTSIPSSTGIGHSLRRRLRFLLLFFELLGMFHPYFHY